jgi:hypothetical protein
MTKPNSQTITIANQAHTITADNRARFRFSECGGRIDALFDPDLSYLHSVRLVWALLDEAGRARYPAAVDLCDHIALEDEAILRPALESAVAAKWLPDADT